MDQQFINSFIDTFIDHVTERVSQRLRPAIGSLPMAANGENEYVSTRQAAALLGVSVKGLEQMRAQGRGPKFTRVGKAIRYRRSDL
jgi:hypothetical protein